MCYYFLERMFDYSFYVVDVIFNGTKLLVIESGVPIVGAIR